MSNISNMFQSYMLEARARNTKYIQQRVRWLQAQKNIAIKVAATALNIKNYDEIPKSVMEFLDPLNREIEDLNKLEKIMESEIYDLTKRADEIVASHEKENDNE